MVRWTKSRMLRTLLPKFFLFAYVFQCFFGDLNHFGVNFWLDFLVALLLTFSKSDHDQDQTTNCSNKELMELIIVQNVNCNLVIFDIILLTVIFLSTEIHVVAVAAESIAFLSIPNLANIKAVELGYWGIYDMFQESLISQNHGHVIKC